MELFEIGTFSLVWRILRNGCHGNYHRWLKLNNTKLRTIPAEVGKLQQLEHLTMKRNNVESIGESVRQLPCLRTLNLRYNSLTHTSIPPSVFETEELTTLDLSHNLLMTIGSKMKEYESIPIRRRKRG